VPLFGCVPVAGRDDNGAVGVGGDDAVPSESNGIFGRQKDKGPFRREIYAPMALHRRKTVYAAPAHAHRLTLPARPPDPVPCACACTVTLLHILNAVSPIFGDARD
jgi:hypothetical protein